MHRSVKYGKSSGRNSFIKVDGSGSRAQELDGADVIVRLTSSMMQRTKVLNDASAWDSIYWTVVLAVERRTASTFLLKKSKNCWVDGWFFGKLPLWSRPQNTLERAPAAPQPLWLTSLRRNFCRPVDAFSVSVDLVPCSLLFNPHLPVSDGLSSPISSFEAARLATLSTTFCVHPRRKSLTPLLDIPHRSKTISERL